MTSVLRLGVYRERIEKYGGRRSAEPSSVSKTTNGKVGNEEEPEPVKNGANKEEEEEENMLNVTLERQAGKQLGIRLTGNLSSEAGIYIADIQEGSAISQDGRLQKFDRILFINGQDVRNAELSQASALIQVLFSQLFNDALSFRMQDQLLWLSKGQGEKVAFM